MYSCGRRNAFFRVQSVMRAPKKCVFCVLWLIMIMLIIGFYSVSFPDNIDYGDDLMTLHNVTTRENKQLEKARTCVGDRLLADPVTRTLGDNRGDAVIPFMLVPLMLDVYAFQNLMCNISVPVRTLMLVQNMEEPVLSAYLAELEVLYGWSGRLLVLRHPENVGYGGAVNEGLRRAMSRPADEVPFVFVANSDVTFSPTILPRLLRDVHRMTQHDAARMDELAAEVSREPSEYTPSDRPLRVLRAPYSNGTMCTSALLPDRIRYAPRNVRAKEFGEHYGLFTMKHGFAACVLTRLAVSVVGLLDENFFPAYFEDIDYIWRMKLLGFRTFDAPYGKMEHLNNLNLRVMGGNTSLGASVPSRWWKRVFFFRLEFEYARIKWETNNWERQIDWEPFRNQVPLDVWVLDTARNNEIRRYGYSNTSIRPPLYDVSVLSKAGVKRSQ